jgi:hypothetical protein
MASNHPSVPDDDPAVGQVDPEDLLGEDGSVSVSEIKRISNQKVAVETCARIRRELPDAESSDALAERLGVSEKAVRKHARADCACPVDLPRLVYLAGEWGVHPDAE